MADAGEEAADFAISAFVQDHFQDRGTFTAAFDVAVLHVGEAFGQVDAAVELAEDVALDLAGDLDVIDFFDAVSRMREAVRQIAVVRDEDETFRSEIEAADAEYARSIRRQQVDHARSAGRIAS